MGMPLFSRSSYDPPAPVCARTVRRAALPRLPNPDPKHYVFERHEQVGSNLVVQLRYPDCTNYEGRKVLVYANCSIEDLILQGHVDPHFAESTEFFSPVARFAPTVQGWDLALRVAKWL